MQKRRKKLNIIHAQLVFVTLVFFHLHIFHLQLEIWKYKWLLQLSTKQNRGRKKSIIKKYKKYIEDKHTFLTPKRQADVVNNRRSQKTSERASRCLTVKFNLSAQEKCVGRNPLQRKSFLRDIQEVQKSLSCAAHHAQNKQTK